MRREDLTNHLTLRKQEINFFGYEWISIEEAKMNEENSNIIVSVCSELSKVLTHAQLYPQINFGQPTSMVSASHMQ